MWELGVCDPGVKNRRCPKNCIFFGGGHSNIFWNVHPDPWGFMIQFDEHSFQMGW